MDIGIRALNSHAEMVMEEVKRGRSERAFT